MEILTTILTLINIICTITTVIITLLVFAAKSEKAPQSNCFLKACNYKSFKGPYCAYHGNYNDPEVIKELDKNGIEYNKLKTNNCKHNCNHPDCTNQNNQNIYCLKL